MPTHNRLCDPISCCTQAQHYDALLTAYTAAQQPPPGAQAQAGFSNSATALSTAQHTTNKCTHLVPQLVRVNVSGEEKAQLRTTRPRKGFGGGTAHSKAAKSQVSLSRRELSTPAHAPPFPDAAKGDSISLSNPIQNVCATEAHASITVAQTAPSSPQSQGGMDGQGQSSQLDHRNLPDSDDGIKAEHTAMRDEERRAGGWSGPEFRLTEKERDVLRWGHNAHGLTPPDKIDMRLYKKATALEVLVRRSMCWLFLLLFDWQLCGRPDSISQRCTPWHNLLHQLACYAFCHVKDNCSSSAHHPCVCFVSVCEHAQCWCWWLWLTLCLPSGRWLTCIYPTPLVVLPCATHFLP